jgi:hypothetical protein
MLSHTVHNQLLVITHSSQAGAISIESTAPHLVSVLGERLQHAATAQLPQLHLQGIISKEVCRSMFTTESLTAAALAQKGVQRRP